ncbi:MAG: hypothetical protein NZ561_01770 [Phycisphaerae bacterium]|nr:hypothetical protein [Phycisphaerae bacterium]MDW8262656.1 hypothetical protein [Phycisphaerales bacterium]
MPTEDIQSLCQQGQAHLTAMRYLHAERVLEAAEAMALAEEDWDSLARLYMPLQECRRQKRQRCGEGMVRLDWTASAPGDVIDAREVARQIPHGQVLLAGWGSIEPACQLRALAREQNLYLETFLAAVYELAGGARVVAIVPTDEVALPPPEPLPLDTLLRRLPPHSILIPLSELPSGARPGDACTYARTMSLWERLHLPFLSQADATPEPKARIEAYRRTIRVDYACELAHQRLSDTARELSRNRS